MGSNVTRIGDYAFYDCWLLSVVIPNSVTRIGDEAFSNCSSLTSVNFNGTVAQWNAISKGWFWEYNVPSTCKVICTDGTIKI